MSHQIFIRIAGTLFLVILPMICWAQQNTECIIKTSLGDIQVEINTEKAPMTAGNFLKYVEAGLYRNSSFFRVCTPNNESGRTVMIEVIQGGDVTPDQQLAPIRLETTRETGILHKNGTISMARDTPDSATSSFFICVNDQPELDFEGKRNPDGQGFAAFGKVTRGMDVVLAIQGQEDTNQYLIEPIVIYNIFKVPSK